MDTDKPNIPMLVVGMASCEYSVTSLLSASVFTPKQLPVHMKIYFYKF